MTRPGISALIPTFGEDVVAIYQQSDEGDDVQILADAKLIHANIDEHTTFFRHPLENGRSFVDHRIFQPVTIDFTIILVDRISVFAAVTSQGSDFILTAKDIYEQIREVWIAGTVLSIQTRTNTYRNQVIEAIPHEETSRLFDGVTMAFSTSEIQFRTENVPTPEKETDLDTEKRGRQNALAVGAAVSAAVLGSAAIILTS